MGVVPTITATDFPNQGAYLNRRVRVCFNYDSSVTVLGTIVRDDIQAPWRTLIKLDDGRLLLASECQYQPIE